MAAPIKLTEVDFEQIKQNLVDYLKSTKQFTDYDFSGSNLQVILNLISYQAQLNAYTTNMVANESFLASATIRNNVVENANMLGYLPTSPRCSIIQVDVEFELPKSSYPGGYPEYLEINPGSTLMAGVGSQSFTFNLVDTQISAIVSSSGVCRFYNLLCYEGLRLEKTFTVDGTEYNQKYILKNSGTDTTTIRVEVQEDSNEDVNKFYNQANNLVSLTQDSRVYWIEETRDGYYELTFGDGYFGKKLKDGAKIFVTYIATNGALANGIQEAEKYTYIGKTTDSFGGAVNEIGTIKEVGLFNSGSEVEDVSSIKFRAPKSYAAQARCVTSDDYESLIRSIFPAVDDIYVFGGETLEIPQYGRIYVSVKPTTGDAISTITKNYIKRSLEPFRVGSLDIVFVDPDVVNVEIVSTVFYDESATIKDSSLIVAAVKDSLLSYNDSSTISKFGGTVRYSNIVSIIDDSDGAITRNNTTFRLRKDIKPVINTNASYEVCFLNEVEVDCNSPVVSSSGFKLEINNIIDERVYYFEDDTQGNIRTFFYTENNTKVIKDNEFGTIDYEKGEIKLGYQKPIKIINVTADSEILEVRVIPRKLDIIAKESVFLNLDVGQSSIGSTIDTNMAKS